LSEVLFYSASNSLDYRKKFCVNNDDHGYFPAARDGKEGFDITTIILTII